MSFIINVDNKLGSCMISSESEIITKVERSENGGEYEVIYDTEEIKGSNQQMKTFTDYSCDIGVSYIYKLNGATELKAVSVNYEDIILYDGNTDNAQLICFNPSISTLKKNQAISITQTLGGRFPVVRKNGDMDYYSFTLGGLISILAENINKDYTNRTLEERNFRNKFINMLSNGNVKLFKSGPEGLMLVRVTDVSLTPEAKLGRDIYSFSATITEVAEANITNLKKYNLFTPVGEYFTVINNENVNDNIYFIVRSE